MDAAKGPDRDRNHGAADGRSRLRVALVVPTRGAAGKSRLVPPPGVRRAALAQAMALDTIAAAEACALVREVVVVTSDLGVAAGVPPCLRVVPDPGGGLAAAILAGLAELGASGRPGADGGAGVVGVLLGDLPALRPEDLAAALDAAMGPARDGAPQESDRSGGVRMRGRGHDDVRQPCAFVPDHDGTGTVLLVGPAGRLRPAFGAGSAARHATSARRLDLDLPRLRRDVDDAADLAAAVVLGVGQATRAALAGDGSVGGDSGGDAP